MDTSQSIVVRARTWIANKMLPEVIRKAIVRTAGKAMIVPIQLTRIAQDAQTRKDAIAEAERAYFPFRYKMQQLFLNTADNGHILACMERRKDLTLLRKFEVLNAAGELDEETSLIFCNNVKGAMIPKTWFTNFLSHALDALPYGYSLIELGDIVDDSFPKLGVVKRWNVSPDRFEVAAFPYMPHGVKFLEAADIKDWYIYIDTPNNVGTSPCGYGYLWDVSIYEIFLRNLLGFNGTFVELFAQPFRWGKTTKTAEAERQAFADMLQSIGSSGWGMGDPDEDVEFKETALGGTGYKGYDNLESRLQKLISKVILGHGDAMDSTPGKIGATQGEDSPSQQALRDKQTKDGTFAENIINDLLIPALRNLGFNIPVGTTIRYKNDAEVMETANKVSDLAVKIASAGLQIDPDYFEEQTGIPVTVTQTGPSMIGGINKPPGPGTQSIENRLKNIYRHKHNA